MADLLPTSADVEAPEGEPRVLGVDSDDADEVLGALSSSTARSLLAALHEEPATPSELADRADTSLQNAQYHLEKLEEANLITVRGTRYSEKGREMNVYGPTDGPLVLFAGPDDAGSSLRSALSRLLGAVAVLAAASLAVQATVGSGFGGLFGGGDASGGMGAMDAGASGTAEGAAGAFGLPPGALFFLGGALVLAALGVWWYVDG